ncbi:uncharacterized protein LOC117344064 isoform X2 [Pecten maximus]|uniref:uncharacterized protein LOC117344064 isoform X2 n=1 Tax=Pecten maximus TaxID=6579 RepID=UPI001458CDF0|nr:uncharacterized protein LOC117344064 isoform X2 [Pecten maximus]
MGCGSSKIFPSDSPDDKERLEKNPRVLIGDVTTKKEKKKEREMKIKEKQLIRNSKAMEMSGKIMEEKERLSLGMRSRGTSQATSRAGSPTPTSHKQVHFRPDEVKMMNSSVDSNSSSTYRFPPMAKPVKSSLKNQNETYIQIVIEKSSDFSKNNDKIDDETEAQAIENYRRNEKKEEHTEVKQVNNKLCTIEERTNSRCSTKSDDVKKG